MNDHVKGHLSNLTKSIPPPDQVGSKDPILKGSTSLDRKEAVEHLIKCRNLAASLAGQGMDIELNNRQDRLTLQGFEAVWLEDSELQSEAGLTPAHIATLGYLLAQE